jgi:hypothetical protein
MKEPITIGQRIVAALVAHQLGITTDRAMKLYVQRLELDPSWEEIGASLLERPIASVSVDASLNSARGLHIVRSKPASKKTNPRKDRRAGKSKAPKP